MRLTMKRPAVFFDRDNTLIANDGYLGDPAGVVLIPGAADAVARVRALGYATVVVSNQSGVGRGMFSEEAVQAVNAKVDELLRAENTGAVIDRHEFCPFHPEATIEHYRRDSDLRKPGPGMIFSAADKLALDLSQSWLIGDAPRDIEAGKTAGCRTILFRSANLSISPAASEQAKVEADYTVATLGEAIDAIDRHRDDMGKGIEAVLAPVVNLEKQKTSESEAALVRDAASGAERGSVADHSSCASAENSISTARLETLAQEILVELRRSREVPHADFSISKLFAGIVQVLVFAALFVAYLYRGDPATLVNTLMFALVLQTMTIALLIMSRQH